MRVLALHGFTGCGEDFKGFSPLCNTLPTWHCLTLPGHGPQPQIDCTPAATVELIHEKISNFNAPHSTPSNILLGYSMGARAALNYVCAYPDSCDALILIGPNPGIETSGQRAERRAADELLARQIEVGGLTDFLNYWEETPLIRGQRAMDTDWRAEMLANRSQHTTTGLAASLRHFGQGSCPNLWPELSKLPFPVLLLTGRNDSKYTAISQRMAYELPKARHQIIDGASHAPHFEAPEVTAAAINQFITSTQPV